MLMKMKHLRNPMFFRHIFVFIIIKLVVKCCLMQLHEYLVCGYAYSNSIGQMYKTQKRDLLNENIKPALMKELFRMFFIYTLLFYFIFFVVFFGANQ